MSCPRLVADAFGEVDRFGHDLLGFDDSPLLLENVPEPIAAVDRQLRKHESMRLFPAGARSLLGVSEPPHSPQHPRGIDQCGEVGLVVEAASDLRAFSRCSKQSFGSVVLVCRLVLDPQSFEIRAPRTPVERFDASGHLDNCLSPLRHRVRARSGGCAFLWHPEFHRRLVRLALEVEHRVGDTDGARAFEVRPCRIDVLEREGGARCSEERRCSPQRLGGSFHHT